MTAARICTARTLKNTKMFLRRTASILLFNRVSQGNFDEMIDITSDIW
jgi:hypothetical protein